ncbi:MAG: fibronectin type III domain-containing protein [Bacteroidetes bacterium]|nr:fibronectin type III domain-containing protein [Bacteroidota bacterium]
MKRFYFLAATLLTAYQLNAQTYCTPAFSSGCNGGDVIDSFSIPGASFNHANTGCSTGAYGDYYATETINLQAGVPYSFQTTNNYSGQKVKIWVDFNNDGTFANDASELVSSGTVATSNSVNGNIMIPGAVTPGTYRMRIADRWSTDPIPCNTAGYGEAHDYKVVISAPPACVSPTAFATANVTSTSVDTSWTASTSNPANGYVIYYDTSNTPPTDTTTPILTNITGTSQVISGLQPSTTYYLWIRSNCGTGSQSLWYGGNSITTVTFCPTVTAPANNANGQSLTPTITWNAVTGATGYTLTVGSSPGASDVLGGVDVGNVTSYTFATPLALSSNYYYTVNAYNTTITSNSCTERSFTTMCTPYTIPYFEGFESGYTHDATIAGCLAQEGVTGSGTWKANNTYTDYNRTPRTGAWNAFIGYGNERWMFIPIDLTGGVSYKFTAYARQDGSTAGNSNMTVSYGTTASAAAMTNTIVPTMGIVNGDYQKISGNFTPATTGTYFVGIKGYMNYSPWYISLDDISIDVAGSCLEPVSVSSSGSTTSSINVAWVAPSVLPASGYDIYYSTTNTPPDATSTPNATVPNTQTTYTINGLTADTMYYVWVRSKCSTSDLSPWTGPASNITGYCIPSAGATSTSYYLSNITSTGGTTNLGYIASAYTAYDNQMATVFSGSAGSTIDATLTASSGTNYFYVWVDWNNDLDFNDAGETVIATTSYTANAVANIAIPAAQPVGNYRARMALSWSGQITPCGPAPYGNYVDFTLNVTPNAGTSEITSTKDFVKVYPNPFAEVLNISDIKDVKSISIADATGRLVKTIAKPTAELHLGDLKTGMYLLTLQYKDGSTKTIKAMKK